MRKVLHIVAAPREDESRTLQMSGAFLEIFQKVHNDWVFEELNLTKERIPGLTMQRLDGKYLLLNGKDLFGEFKEAWEEILQYIAQFLSADLIVLSTPMWNFSIPYILKHYIDVIVQPKYLFRYTESGIEGLAKNKKMIIFASRGGDYSSAKTKLLDFQEPYLRTIFGFVGISDIDFVIAQPMDMGEEVQRQKLQEAVEKAKDIATRIVHA